ncbi:c-type cytochrome [Marivita sp.]|uniref:c-type cytochrome n=1 Tax=Marivita sp. TaxID=2003365 RepID=UPI003F73047F
MMKNLKFAVALVALGCGSAAYAQDDFTAQLKARQGQMRIIALNLGILGGMAQGKTEYDAAAAQTAADSLVAVSGINQDLLWPAGSHADSIEGTKALAVIWENNDGFMSNWSDFGEAALAMQAAAGGGQAALGPAMGTIGGTCKACHDDYRVAN